MSAPVQGVLLVVQLLLRRLEETLTPDEYHVVMDEISCLIDEYDSRDTGELDEDEYDFEDDA
jgi:hypothetical protein